MAIDAQKVILDVGTEWSAGDKISFRVSSASITTPLAFNVTLPANTPKKLIVTLPGEQFTREALQVTDLQWNDTPVSNAARPRHTPEMLALLREHKQALDAHLAKYHQNERIEVREVIQESQFARYLPISEVEVAQPFGFWRFPRTQAHYTAAESSTAHQLVRKPFTFVGGNFELTLDVERRPWFSASGVQSSEGHDLEVSAALHRLPTGEQAQPLALMAHLQVEGPLDRWTKLQPVLLGPSESYSFDLGDLRDIARSEWSMALTVMLHLTTRRR